jgi:hypothetical protein
MAGFFFMILPQICCLLLVCDFWSIKLYVGGLRLEAKKRVFLPNQRRRSQVRLIDHPADKKPVPFNILGAFYIARHPGSSTLRDKRIACPGSQ